MRKSWLSKTLLAAGVFSGIPTAEQALADAAAPPSDSLQEIVVTAQKRATNLQDTPISISAVTGDELVAAGISDVSTIAQSTPGVAVNSAGPGRTVYNINGISSSAGSSSTVGFYLDDVPLTPATDGGQTSRFFFDPDLFDVARVEVLRGPQGTLYGAGSMGGTIRIITNEPQMSQFRASADLNGSDTYHSNGTNWGASGMVNIPLISDWAALRVAVSDKYYDGWIDRVVLTPFPTATSATTRGNVLAAPVSNDSTSVNTERLQAARARLLMEPLSELKITLGFDYQHMSQGAPDLADSPPGVGYYAHYAAFNTPEPAADQTKLSSATIEYTADRFSVTSTSAVVQRSSLQNEETGEVYNYLFGGFGAPLLPTSITNAHRDRQFSEELRLASVGDQALHYVVGAFYQNFTNTFENYSDVAAYLPLFGLSDVASVHQRETLKEKALFGEVSYEFLEHFTATAGLRWYRFDYDAYTNTGVTLTGAPPPLNVQDQNTSGTSWLPKASISYQPYKELLTYLTYSEGSRIGGSNINVPTAGPNSCLPSLQALGLTEVPQSYSGDGVKSTELGVKSSLLGNRMTIDGSAFYIRWDQVQQLARLGCGYPLVLNEGVAISKGGNLQVEAQITSAIKAAVSAGYTNAALSQSFPGIATRGEQLQGVPRVTQSMWAEVKQPVGFGLYAMGRINNTYYGASRDIMYLPSYDLLSLRLGIANESTWTANFFIDNVTNRIAELSNTQSLAANIPTLDRIAINRPRTTGFQFTYKY